MPYYLLALFFVIKYYKTINMLLGSVCLKKYLKIALICLLIFIVAFVVWKVCYFFKNCPEEICLESVSWNGREYSNLGGEYTEGKTIAWSKDLSWVINEVVEDPSHTFIVARRFLDDALLVSDDYIVPRQGKLTTVSWNGNYITDPLFLDTILKLESEKTTSFSYLTDNIYDFDENVRLRDLYFAYENCPVTTNFIGYMGKVDGEWAITTYVSEDTRKPNGAPKPYLVSCYKIPEEYWEILSEYYK